MSACARHTHLSALALSVALGLIATALLLAWSARIQSQAAQSGSAVLLHQDFEGSFPPAKHNPENSPSRKPPHLAGA